MARSLNASTTLPSSKLLGSPTLTLFGGSASTLGNMNRAVPSVMPTMAAVNAVQAMTTESVAILTRNQRRSSLAGGLPAGGLAGIAGLATAGGGVAGGFAGVGAAGVVGVAASDIEPGPLAA